MKQSTDVCKAAIIFLIIFFLDRLFIYTITETKIEISITHFLYSTSELLHNIWKKFLFVG
jgi:hypothetical protein